MDKVYSVVDIETTGLSPEDNEIIEIGIVKILKGKIKGKFHSLVKPKNPIPSMIQKLTGINDEMVKESPSFEEIAVKLKKFIGDSIFVAHNAEFDFNVINASLKKAQKAALESKVVDTQELVTIVYPALSSYRLSSLAQKLGIYVEEKHRAMSDAEATAQLFILLIREIKKMNKGVLREIVKLGYGMNWPLYDIFSEALDENNTLEDSGTTKFIKDIIKPSTDIVRKKKQKLKGRAVIDQKEINEFFKKRGALAKNISNYEVRSSQIEMASTIANTFNKPGHLVIEAGTGTGKSAAYLYPSILYSLNNRKPIVVSTRTKNLQEQLIDKDMPLLKKSLKHNFYAVVVKGIENYFCLKKWDMHYRLIVKRIAKDDLSIFFGLLNWLSQTGTGDISELHSMLYYKANQDYKSESRTCLKEKCHYIGSCFYNLIKRNAHKADIIIVNHALLFSDVNLKGGILPQYDQLIIDEAHNIEDAATESFSVVLSSKVILDILRKFVDNKSSVSIIEELELFLLKEIKNLKIIREVKLLIKEINKTIDHAFKITRKTFEIITNFVNSEKLKETGLVNIQPLKRGEIWKLIINLNLKSSSKWNDINESLSSLYEEINKLTKQLDSLRDIIENNNESRKPESICLDLVSASGQFQDILNAIKFVFTSEENYISWIEVDTSLSPWVTNIYSAPINVGQYIYESIISKKENIVFTSATLSINNNFEYFKKRVGLNYCDLKVDELKLGTEFDYQKQALICIPQGLNTTRENENNLNNVSKLLAQIIISTQGRTLVLFTSYKMLQDVYFSTQGILSNESIMVYCQGRHGSRRSILDRFKDEKRAVIFGTDSFWEGVDLPGEDLSCLVMMKLPFAVPTEPVVLARTEDVEFREGNGFLNYSVPYAVIKFRQGIGRLIRTKKDRGIAVIFDDRLYEKTYGQVFLNSISEYSKVYETPENILKTIKSWIN